MSETTQTQAERIYTSTYFSELTKKYPRLAGVSMAVLLALAAMSFSEDELDVDAQDMHTVFAPAVLSQGQFEEVEPNRATATGSATATSSETPTPPPTETAEPSPTPEKETLTVSAGHPVFERALDTLNTSDSSRTQNVTLPEDGPVYEGVYENDRLVPVAVRVIKEDGSTARIPLTEEFLAEYGDQLPDLEDQKNIQLVESTDLQRTLQPEAQLRRENTSRSFIYSESLRRGEELWTDRPFTVDFSYTRNSSEQNLTLRHWQNAESPVGSLLSFVLAQVGQNTYDFSVHGGQYNFETQQGPILERSNIAQLSGDDLEVSVTFDNNSAYASYTDHEGVKQTDTITLPFDFTPQYLDVMHTLVPPRGSSAVTLPSIQLTQESNPHSILEMIRGNSERQSEVRLRTIEEDSSRLRNVANFVIQHPTQVQFDDGTYVTGVGEDHARGYAVPDSLSSRYAYDVAVAEAREQGSELYRLIELGEDDDMDVLELKLQSFSEVERPVFPNFFSRDRHGRIQLNQTLLDGYGNHLEFARRLGEVLPNNRISVMAPTDIFFGNNTDESQDRMAEIIQDMNAAAGRELFQDILFNAETAGTTQITNYSRMLERGVGLYNYGTRESQNNIAPYEALAIANSGDNQSAIILAPFDINNSSYHLISTSNGSELAVNQDFVNEHVEATELANR